MVAVNKPGQSNNNITGASGSMPRVKTKTRGVGDYGIFSSSGYVGASRNLNRYDYRGYNAQRASSIVRSNIGSMPRTHYQPQPQPVNTGMSAAEGFALGMTIVQSLGALGQMIMQMVGSSKAASASSDINSPSAGDLGTGNSDITSIQNMKKATDSTSLRTAITTAEQELNGIDLSSLETAAKTAKEGLDTCKENVKTSKKAMDESKKTMDSAASDKNQAISTLNSHKDLLSQAGQAYVDAVNDVRAKEASLQQAEAALIGVSPDDPNFETLQRAVTEANNALEAAKNAETEAKEALTNAENAEKDAKMNLEKMIKNYEDASKQYEESKTNYKTKKEAYEAANKEYSDRENTINEYEEAKSKYEKLTDSIEEQKARLQKLEQAEAKEFEKNQEKLLKLQKENESLLSKIDYSDGKTTQAEKRSSRKIDANAEEMTTLKARQTELENNIKETVKAERPTKTLSNGTELRMKTINGKTYYLKGDELIRQDQYQALLDESN